MYKSKYVKNLNFVKHVSKTSINHFNHPIWQTPPKIGISTMMSLRSGKVKQKMSNELKMNLNNCVGVGEYKKKNKNIITANSITVLKFYRVKNYSTTPPSSNEGKEEKNNKPSLEVKESRFAKYIPKIPEWKVVQEKLKNLPAIIKDELIHYYKGFKLLFRNVKLSTQLVYRILKGDKLKRSESALLERTVADIFRLVPFIIIILVPFMEFLLPFILKMFPNMLPSTFATKDQKQANIQKQIQARLGLAKFLQGATEKLLLEEIKGGITEEDFNKFTKKVKKDFFFSFVFFFFLLKFTFFFFFNFDFFFLYRLKMECTFPTMKLSKLVEFSKTDST